MRYSALVLRLTLVLPAGLALLGSARLAGAADVPRIANLRVTVHPSGLACSLTASGSQAGTLVGRRHHNATPPAGQTLGLRRENNVECFAARVGWNWACRADVGPSVMGAARRVILDDSRRPPADELLPSCTLPG